ncbi:PA3715 family protein [Quatrionicoccus australiensis]|uniref:hypothetical protein n=1 Tax=Quatrionicoccus australiensis TaxID=138118 RepID=UPI001CF82C4B|nr:hypothetical protein [Quatrionicoccus australiensis]UCV13723.1 hypothetical protein KI612_12230 [Quatrionicoccus australiensis]
MLLLNLPHTMLKKILLLPILLASSSLVWSQSGDQTRCDRELLADVFGDHQKITFEGLNRKSQHEWTELALVCKERPGHSNQVVVATFFVPNKAPAEFEARDVGFVVALVDQAQRRLLSLHTSMLQEDGGTNAFWHGSLAIDTARNDLKNGVRAIGVRMDIVRPGCAWDGASGDTLWLFQEQGAVLQPVLSGFDMYRSERQFFKGCVCCSQEESKGAVHDASLTLSVASTSSNGYQDLAIRATLSSSVYNLPEIKDEIVSGGLLKFDGQQYRREGVEQEIGDLLEARKRKCEKWR